jgi:hypothetical protein
MAPEKLITYQLVAGKCMNDNGEMGRATALLPPKTGRSLADPGSIPVERAAMAGEKVRP